MLSNGSSAMRRISLGLAHVVLVGWRWCVMTITTTAVMTGLTRIMWMIAGSGHVFPSLAWDSGRPLRNTYAYSQ